MVAVGSISVESYTKTVQHLRGGIVESIHVEDGDRFYSYIAKPISDMLARAIRED